MTNTANPPVDLHYVMYTTYLRFQTALKNTQQQSRIEIVNDIIETMMSSKKYQDGAD